ncbi:M14 family zinc carboxypeptidase [Flavobacterium glaciei]|uniref:Zinc carboxypeptidase n=1 Tax=Flavobacterium glaciei TaxID=386300 RepID=A0A562Q5I1_9FLAO|nr:M14 family zinc carboxypeptidase [Flavobacterium glaciei]RDI58205.1 zinc carboxypeptidase [Flavobacterium glaciei]TWI51992.1 zinc carboxypeptidase [Flavobacterium glaciei]
MKKNYLLVFITILLFNQFSFAQHNPIAKRILITKPSPSQLLQIKNAGIDLGCGAIFHEENLTLELGSQELKSLEKAKINYTVLIKDLKSYYEKITKKELPKAKKELEEQKKLAKNNARSLSTKSTTINNFIQYEGCTEVDWAVPQNFELGSMAGCLTYDEVLSQLDLMRAKYPNLISVKANASPTNQVTHGNAFTNSGAYNTWSGQTIYYVRISDNPDSFEANEPESLYSGMTHSREVSSLMNIMYYMWYVLENYSTDPGIKNLVDNHQMYFIPVVNPDGLKWNEQIAPSGGGLQRKNLNPSANTGNNDARGVDLNRNFNYFWGASPLYNGSSGTTSNQTYRGTSAASEPETRIIRDFSLTRNFKTALNHHATSNLMPHSYNGYPAAPPSGRENEYAKFCQDLTRFNRYIYGEAPDVLTVANGDLSDWMLGGVADVNGSTGSGKQVLALSPEHGAPDGSEGGFWPTGQQITDIAKRGMRMNFVNAYYSGKFTQFHDQNSTEISTKTGDLKFGLEYLGQTLGNITLTVTPVSSNITSITSPPTQTGWTKLEQRTVNAAYVLNEDIKDNEIIEFKISLTNDDGYVMYETNIIKYFNPTVFITDNPDVSGITNWTSSGGAWGTTTDSFSGTAAITDSPAGAYANNTNKTLRLNTPVNLANSAGAVVQFYAKWDLERNFDYAQFQASVDGTNWVSLCGKYTKPASSLNTNRYNSASSTNTSPTKTFADRSNQPTGQLVYEGDTMDKWVMEEIYISPTENSSFFGQSNVQFRFLLDSDSSNRADGYSTTFDGFVFDDFKIIKIPSAPPVAICKPATLSLNSSGSLTVLPSDVDNNSTDDVGITSITVSPNTFDCTHADTTQNVTLTVTDADGQTSTCIATVTIIDVTPPVTPTLANITGQCSVTPIAPTTTDVCAGTIIGTTTTVFPITTPGTTVVTWSFDDGNGQIVTANQNIIIGTTTWDGTTWSNSEPVSGMNAVISGNLIINSNLTACSLSVNNNAVVTVNSGFNLNIAGDVSVASGSSLTFESNANLIQSKNTNGNTGNIIVKRKTSPLMLLDYVLWSAPVSGQQLQLFSPSTLSNRFYTYNPSTNFYSGIASTNNFATGTGYLIRMPNNHPTTPTIWEGQFQGVPNNGNYNLTVTNNTYNAIGNPYPSTINANTFISTNNITEALYFWRKTNNALSTSYATYTLAGGTANAGGLSSIVPNGVIQVGQGFIAKATSNTISFTNAMRLGNNEDQFFRTKNIERNRIWLNLSTPTSQINQMLIAYMTSATAGIDATIDGKYINDNPIALNSLIENQEFIIQGRGLPFVDTDIVPLTFKTNVSGNFNIAIDHVDGLFANQQDIFLMDKLNDAIHDLKKSEYPFSSAIGTFNNRFELMYKNSKTLGIETPIFNENTILIFNNQGVIDINSGSTVMKNVTIFDIRGRIIFEQKEVNATKTSIKDFGAAEQTLIIKITSDQNEVVTKKVVY